MMIIITITVLKVYVEDATTPAENAHRKFFNFINNFFFQAIQQLAVLNVTNQT